MKRIMIQRFSDVFNYVIKNIEQQYQSVKDDCVFTMYERDVVEAAADEKILLITGQRIQGSNEGGSDLAERMKKLNPETIVLCYSSTPMPCPFYDGYLKKAETGNEILVLAQMMAEATESDTAQSLIEKYPIIQKLCSSRKPRLW